jgi:hypothetical protein
VSKYGNKKTVVDGIKFDSKAESVRYKELKFLEQGGAISDLELQKKFILTPSKKLSNGKTERASHYVADFCYVNEDGKKIVEDTKGFRTQLYVQKRKIMLDKHNIEILETK